MKTYPNLRSICTACLLIIFLFASKASDSKLIQSQIKRAVVYRQGALVSREGDVQLLKGRSTIVYKGLSSKLKPETMQVSAASEGVVIVSVRHKLDYLNRSQGGKEIAELMELQRSINDSISALRSQKQVYQQEKEIVLANKVIGGDNGLKIADLEQAVVFARKRLMEIEALRRVADQSIYGLKRRLVSVSQQLMEINKTVDLPTSIIEVVVSTASEIKTKLLLNYYVPDAGWDPSYDIRIDEVDDPLKLGYKANVWQDSDEAWDNIVLTLSTGNPALDNNKPELLPYYLTFNNYYRSSPAGSKSSGSFNGTVSGRVLDENGEPLPGASIVEKGTANGVVSDVDGRYTLRISDPKSVLVCSFIGFDPVQAGVAGQVNFQMKPSQLQMDEVVVVAYGVSGDVDLMGRTAGLKVSKAKEMIPMSIEKQQTSTEFQITMPYSIPSDKQPYDVTMVEYLVPASYQYYAVPKLSSDVFLMARMSDWQNYHLLNGKANIFFKGIYQGESLLDLESVGDTINLSVGRDKDISISRELQKDYSSRTFSGSTRKEIKSWLITVKNHKATPVSLVVEDQYPISRGDEIKVEVVETGIAKNDAVAGKLTWEIVLQAGELKKLPLTYQVRYPSGKKMIVE